MASKKRNVKSMKISFAIFMIVGLLLLLRFGLFKIGRSDLFTIKTIEFSGNELIESSFLEDATASYIGENSFDISDEQVFGLLESLPVFKSVKLSRFFSKLKIEIVERKNKFILKDKNGYLHNITDDKMILSSTQIQSSATLPIIHTEIEPDSLQIGTYIKSSFVDTVFFFQNAINEINEDFASSISEYFLKGQLIYLYENMYKCRFILKAENLTEQLVFALGILQSKPIKEGSELDLRFGDKFIRDEYKR